MIDYAKYGKSLKHLEAQFRNYLSHNNLNTEDSDPLSDIDREAIAESVIRRFEVCYDCLWKALKRYMIESLGLPELPNSPKPLFRIAFENQLINNIEAWLQYADARTDTSHDYSEDKATEALALMDAFIDDAIALYSRLSGSAWNTATLP